MTICNYNLILYQFTALELPRIINENSYLRLMYKCVAILFWMALVSLASAQDLSVAGLNGKVITKATLADVETLSQLQPGFPDSWIGSYEEVRLTLLNEDESRQVLGTGHELNLEQRNAIASAEIGDEIAVQVSYLSEAGYMETPERKEIKFRYKIVPAQQALFSGGQDAMIDYLQDNIQMEEVTLDDEDLRLTVVGFKIDPRGKIVETTLVNSTGQEDLDTYIINVISEMPAWQPALNSEGEAVSQQFEIQIGNFIGC